MLASAGAIVSLNIAPAFAGPITLGGNYVEIGVSDYGTIGSDGSTSPGMLFDPTGTKSYGNNDFLTPGNPSEGFGFTSTQTGFLSNNNDESASSFGTAAPTLTTVPGYSLAATWTGSSGGVTVTNTEFFNAASEQVNIVTTLTNTTGSALTSVAFDRSLDPDPDFNTYGDYETLNSLGATNLGADGNSAACGSGANTDETVCLVTANGGITHYADIDSTCCYVENPSYFLGYGSKIIGSSDADDSIDLTWNIGTIAAGATVTLNYAYDFGSTLATVGGGTPTPSAPELDPTSALSAITLLLGGIVTLRGRKALR